MLKTVYCILIYLKICYANTIIFPKIQATDLCKQPFFVCEYIYKNMLIFLLLFINNYGIIYKY